MTNESISNAIIGNTLRIIASGEYHPGAELTQKMASYIIELEQKLTDMAVQLTNAESKCRELASENAALNSQEPKAWYLTISDEVTTDPEEAKMWRGKPLVLGDVKTPATDAFLAEVRAIARNEGINYEASRLAAAFNHGFVDKPLAEVCDVVHMILDSKEELASSMLPAADGISGEYAEKFLAEFAGQLRKGGEA